jgi:ferrous iron transport protein A
VARGARATAQAAEAARAKGATDAGRQSGARPEVVQATLEELGAGQTGRVRDVRGKVQVVARLAALGFVPDTPILMVQNFGSGPVIVEVRGTRVALGRREASKVHLTRSE